MGALAAIPIPGYGFASVWIAVTITTVVPLDLLVEELLEQHATASRS